MILLQGPTGWWFLISEVTLFPHLKDPCWFSVDLIPASIPEKYDFGVS